MQHVIVVLVLISSLAMATEPTKSVTPSTGSPVVVPPPEIMKEKKPADKHRVSKPKKIAKAETSEMLPNLTTQDKIDLSNWLAIKVKKKQMTQKQVDEAMKTPALIYKVMKSEQKK